MGRGAVSIATLALLVACGGGGDGGSSGSMSIPLIGANAPEDGGGTDGVPDGVAGGEPGGGGVDVEPDGGAGGGIDPPGSGTVGDSGGFPLPPVTGTAGQAVDCADTLPCTWRSPQDDFTFTLTRADSRDSSVDPNEADFRYDDLGVLYEVVVDNDTTLTFLDDASFADADFGAGNLSTQQFLNFSTAREFGSAVLTLLGGTTSRVFLVFDAGVKGIGSIDTLTIPLLRDERRVEAVFGNVPHGRVRAPDRDCENVLPCTWTSPGGTTRVTVDDVGITALGELRVDLSVVTDVTETTLSLFSLSRAAGSDLASFSGDAQRLGTASDYSSGIVNAIVTAGETIPASVRFGQAPNPGLSSLARLSLDLFETIPLSPNAVVGSLAWNRDRLSNVPRLDPVFRNLPLAQ